MSNFASKEFSATDVTRPDVVIDFCTLKAQVKALNRFGVSAQAAAVITAAQSSGYLPVANDSPCVSTAVISASMNPIRSTGGMRSYGHQPVSAHSSFVPMPSEALMNELCGANEWQAFFDEGRSMYVVDTGGCRGFDTIIRVRHLGDDYAIVFLSLREPNDPTLGNVIGAAVRKLAA